MLSRADHLDGMPLSIRTLRSHTVPGIPPTLRSTTYTFPWVPTFVRREIAIGMPSSNVRATRRKTEHAAPYRATLRCAASSADGISNVPKS
ncbi:hypothetical protein Trydic_g18646 [Trypoxylus dichotomus]